MAFTNRISMDALTDVNDLRQNFETKKCVAPNAYNQTNNTLLLIRRHVDFIVESPYDVLCCIMDFLDGDIDTLLKCIEVCHAWKQILLQCPTPWRTICTDRSFWTASVLTIRRQQLLGKISPFVEKIYVHGPEDALVRCIDFFRLYKFSSLRFLEIKCLFIIFYIHHILLCCHNNILSVDITAIIFKPVNVINNFNRILFFFIL